MFEWSCRQAYIALANMLTTFRAAACGLHAGGRPELRKGERIPGERRPHGPRGIRRRRHAAGGYHDPTHIMKPKTRQKAEDVVEFLK